jgi:predicted outer membrane protein
MRTSFMITLLALAALLIAGCATLEDESDLPWNTPQPWEGSPAIPGFNQY